MAEQLEERMYLILKAQSENLATIATDLILPGTTPFGTQIKLWGPAPDLIRMYDTPLRFIQTGILEGWERLITLAPLTDNQRAAIVGRSDRDFRYQISVLVRLTEAEIESDRTNIVVGNLRADTPLARKAHRLIYDFHHVFHNNLSLSGTSVSTECLVSHSEYNMVWDPGVTYPNALFTAEVSGIVAGW